MPTLPKNSTNIADFCLTIYLVVTNITIMLQK